MRTPCLLALSLALVVALPDVRATPDDDPDEAAFAVDRGGTLYRIDCLKQTYEPVGTVRVPLPDGGEEAPVLCDLAATPDGYLYGVSTTSIYLINLSDPRQSKKVGDHGLDAPYGMGFHAGRLIANTADGQVFVIDPRTAESTAVGPMGGGYVASGDLDVHDGRVFSSVKDAAGAEILVELDPATGHARPVGPFRDAEGAPISHVFGIIEAKGELFGLTSSGALLRIDAATGQCQVLLRTGVLWWGASAYLRI